MANKMLIDASHVEETRVVVLRDNRVEELDFESEHKKQIKGNIYLAKVTRVEPSLQAAFVDYGGNRHGFLPFLEIHPDYYQIPFSDRQALLKESNIAQTDSEAVADDVTHGDVTIPNDHSLEEVAPIANFSQETEEESIISANNDVVSNVEDVKGGSPEDVPKKFKRQYCIQEVIKNRQILLVQIVKEERGNKGAAVTTYLSLAGRYSVLMPNTSKGETISRKITNPVDRKNLKEIARGLEVPAGMGVILRTAGASRTKIEIKRDFEYLMRLWDNVRELALNSVAPHLVYEEGNLIKRAIRDLYCKDISEIIVSGEKGYREAKDFMKLLMPSYARIVRQYEDPHPIFFRSGIEVQLDSLHQTEVTLPSRGYVIINQTEALVSIDVNSGRSTREHCIEDTALQTNLEAAEEIARQLRLRDLAGLIVVDFIDMEEKKNNRSVEKKLKESLKKDRARVQVGAISNFGLLEMSRQRIRSSVLESTTKVCTYCKGAGYIRSQSSVALSILRSVEEYLLQYTAHNIIVHTHSDVVLYLLNQKRATIVEYEARFGVSINVVIGIELADKLFYIEKGSPVQALVNTGHKVGSDSQAPSYDKNIECVWQDEALLPIPKSESLEDIQDNIVSEESTGVIRKRRRRRRRRRPATDHHDAGVVSDVSSIQNVIDDSFDMYMEPSDITNHNLLENGAHGFTENYDVSIPPVSTPEMESSNSSSDPIVKKTRWWKRRK
ncbi:ribonuclease E/G [Candidatus Liberibacter asiaticus]|uniref:Ribonuclease E n=2 Tax=Liberibacter asiaticus TaxID=34021 RepID=C6XFS1_LIBAP|nr:ribonuclease E/G [Candidatus Liberibacter asiaticus]ACT57224.1 ribonuclease E [Candidatus Liberibacter asiaticus str. psy62]AGH16816.1 ribonuclease E [Candidatus Liberibacter asiaticus str. gxpsy]ALK07176.1 Rne/Rng family ribonuclease [Candidatus Liberibacter asiaticus]ASK52656.1 ribonuclease E/G [Candidatus Liberibacter asiaticus]AWL13980.1 ribonuclease E/G [Candidatus Liberibacter asiaticus]